MSSYRSITRRTPAGKARWRTRPVRRSSSARTRRTRLSLCCLRCSRGSLGRRRTPVARSCISRRPHIERLSRTEVGAALASFCCQGSRASNSLSLCTLRLFYLHVRCPRALVRMAASKLYPTSLSRNRVLVSHSVGFACQFYPPAQICLTGGVDDVKAQRSHSALDECCRSLLFSAFL